MANVITYGVTLDASGAIAGFKKLDGAMDANEKKLTRWQGIAAKAGVAVGAALGTAAVLGIRKMITETVEAQHVQAQLAAGLRSTAGASGQTVASLNAQSAALMRMSTFSDEAVGSAQALLLTFTKISGDAFPRATRAIADMATRMGGDLQGATIQVGKALNDPILGITALGRAGVQFSESQKHVIARMVEMNNLAGAQSAILAELETQFGGSAAAARNTLGGALAHLSNQFGNLFEVDAGQASLLIRTIDNVAVGVERLGVALGGLNDIATRLRLIDGAPAAARNMFGPLSITTARDRGAFGLNSAAPITITADLTDAAKRRIAFDEQRRNAAERAGWEDAEILRLGRIVDAAHQANLARLGRSATTNAVRAPAGLGAGFHGTFANGARITPKTVLVDNERAAIESAKRIADARADIEENFLRGSQAAFSSFFVNLATDGMSSFKGLMTSFKDLVIQTVAELAAKKLMGKIFAEGSGGILGMITKHPVIAGIAAAGLALGAIFGGRGSARGNRESAYRQQTALRQESYRKYMEQFAPAGGATSTDPQIRQSVGGVLTETSAARIVGNLESIRVGIFQLVALAKGGALGGNQVTVNASGSAPGGMAADAAAALNRILGGDVQRLRLAAGVAVLP